MLAVAGGKGGCGKTTTTLGLAAALVRQRKSAVAVDADREMPNLHAMAGVQREPGLDAVADGWPPEFVAGTAQAPVPGVAVIPAASGPRKAQPSNPPTRDSPSSRRATTTRATTGLARVGRRADAVLLDCPAGAGPDAVAPLRVADAAVVVTTAEPACLRDAAKTAAMARELGTAVAGAVVTRAEEVPEGLARLLGCPVLGVVPDAGVGVKSETGTPADPLATDPLAADPVRAAHDRILSALQPKYL
jgi:septum site-determining protein MinD